MSPDFPENLYEVLGVEPDVTDAELRRAGRARQRETHPDLGGDAQQFTRVRLAVEVLTNPRRRSEHDSWLAQLTGVAPVRRDHGVRLRQQQRASRARPAPPRPATHSTAAGTDEVPTFERLPQPKVDARRMGWYRTQWHPHPEVWPPARPLVHGPRLRELLTVLPFILCTIGVCIAQSLFGLSVPWWLASYVLLVLALVWISLRWVGARLQLARILFWVNIAGIALDAAGAFLIAMFRIFEGDTERVPYYVARGVLSLVGVLLAMLASWGLEPRTKRMVSERMLCDIANETAPAVDSEQRQWGTPGEVALRHSLAGVNPIRRQYAEQLIGPTLDALERIPGVRIVHGLRLPDGDETISTISHAVLCGRRLALIDDRLWHPGTYGLDARGHVVRNGEPGSVPLDEFPHRVTRFRETFAEVAQVRGWLAITPDGPGEFAVDNSRTWQHVRLASPESLLREVGEWLAVEGEQVDRLLLRDVLELRVDA
ncbi:J domain-containing protein [Gulosibacter sediminis]|uniref:J domain-containing protein n=1 Tax=Gulosibacter sediminis TaxID=1729695 RepID=UPI0024AD284E|nr:J domain-containing protein [Gulosibacter sediminis]